MKSHILLKDKPVVSWSVLFTLLPKVCDNRINKYNGLVWFSVNLNIYGRNLFGNKQIF